ncbi:MAG: hypothetical protein EA403_08530 [Spirochaetaceae bacterium]|nr:MAG: hypothetical protein EA403_08530 [Spirochaetaceae bacterium]
MNEERIHIPLFPLGLVLMPHMPLPLHIFEERYRGMITECIDNDQPFGVVLAGSRRIQEYGCIARIDRVLERYDDGRYDILAMGTQRFHTISTDASKPYLTAVVEVIHDEDELIVDTYIDLARETVKKLEIYAAMVGGTIDRDTLLVLGPQKLSFVAAASAFFTMEQKQTLLQLTRIGERLQFIREALEQAIIRRKMTRTVQRVIGEKDDISHLFN